MTGRKLLFAGSLLLLDLTPAGAIDADIKPPSSTQFSADGYGRVFRQFGPGGYAVRFVKTPDRTKPGNYRADAPVGGSFFKGNNVEVSYLRKYDEGGNYKFVFSVPGACVHNWRYAAQLLYDSLHNLDNTVVFSGNKADIFR